MRLSHFPPQLFLNQGQAVRSISIDLICGRENEDGGGRMQACHLKQVECSCRIDGEVGERFLGGPIMAWLGSCVQYKFNIGVILLKKSFNRSCVADVQINMPVVGDGIL